MKKLSTLIDGGFLMIFVTWIEIALLSEIWVIMKGTKGKGKIFRQWCSWYWVVLKISLQVPFMTVKQTHYAAQKSVYTNCLMSWWTP